MTLRLSAIHIYPIKSARGIGLEKSEVDQFGLCHDRRWMLVDQAGQFLSQRSHARLALVVPSIRDDRLRVDAPGMPTLDLPLRPSSAVTTRVTVWKDTCSASWLGQKPARWFSDFLSCSCSLVYMPPDVLRPADDSFAPAGSQVSFADAFPFLLISEASLADLNQRLAASLPMNRFRPNLVVSGGEPYQEDQWTRIQIGSLGFRVVKPCGRCVVTTTDQISGERGREPLRTLAAYRKRGSEIMFGQNVVHEGPGRLRVGDPLLS